MHLCFLSNISLLLPIYIAYAHGLVHVAGVLLAAMFMSMYYHMDEQNDFGLYVDIIGVTVSVTTLNFIYMQSTYVVTPMNLIAMAYGTAALYCYFEAGEVHGDQYEDYHTAWHVLSSYMIAAFIYSHINTSVLQFNKSRLSRPLLEAEYSLLDWLEGKVTVLMELLSIAYCLPTMTEKPVTHGVAGHADSARPLVVPLAVYDSSTECE